MLTYNEQHAELVTPQDILVIGADTVVAYENQILGKPKDEEAVSYTHLKCHKSGCYSHRNDKKWGNSHQNRNQ